MKMELMGLLVTHESTGLREVMVSAVGNILSTLTKPPLKKWWLKKTNI